MRFISDDHDEQRPVWMSPEERENPLAFVSSFCHDYPIADCRFILWHMLSASLSAPIQNDEPSISDQVCFFENLMPALEALHLWVSTDQDPLISKDIESSKIKSVAPERKGCEKDKISDAFANIKEFLASYPASEFEELLFDILQAVTSDKVYSKSCPATVLTFSRNFEGLLEAGHHLSTCCPSIQHYSRNEPYQCDSETKSNYDGPDLSMIFKPIFQFKTLAEWKEELYRICLYALSKEPADEWGAVVDTLGIYRLSTDLVKALHLGFEISNAQGYS
jgi:hypothetical protein